MRLEHIDHVGIAVKSIEESAKLWEALGFVMEGIEEVAEQKVKTAFMPIGEGEIELLEAMDLDSPIAKFIEKKGEGIHHIAIRVDNIESVLANLQEKGVRLLDETPRIGAGGAKIAFIHPKATNGTLLEICERNEKEK